MDYLKQLFQILYDPEYTTQGLYDAPRVRESFLVVSAYAFFSALDSFFSGYFQSETLSVGVISFVGTGLAMYLLWVLVSLIFHGSAELLGGLGEFPHTLGYVGLGIIPLVVTSFITVILRLIFTLADITEALDLLPTISLGLTLVAMLWGTPGMVCYFGLKNAEKLHPLKAMLLSFAVCAALALLLLYVSNLI